MQLTVPVDLYTIKGHIIAKKGSNVTYELLHQNIEKGKKHSSGPVLLKQTFLIKDLTYIFNEEKYFTIFFLEKENQKIVDIAEKIELVGDVVAELNRIKETLPYTYRHILLVTAMATKVALDMKEEGYIPELACMAGFLHDIGKSRIPKKILGKTTPLTESEYLILKSHTILGYLLLCFYFGGKFIEVTSSARDHHEKLNGTGYPRGITKVSKYAQLVAPPDIFDALISVRPYRQSIFTIRQALDFLIDDAEMGRINKDVVYHLISYVRKEHPSPKELKPYPRQKIPTPSDSVYGKIIPDK